MIDKKQCPHCRHGRQTSPLAPRSYPCEDCGGTGELYYCNCCEQWLDSGMFNDPNTPVCMKCEDDGLHLRYWSEGLSVFDRDKGDEFVAGTFMSQETSCSREAYRQACGLAAKIAELLNQENDG